MSKITYHTSRAMPPGIVLQVKLDGKVVGHIRAKKGGYFYKPISGVAVGELCTSIGAVKQMLEG